MAGGWESRERSRIRWEAMGDFREGKEDILKTWKMQVSHLNVLYMDVYTHIIIEL